jgi:hypothetical protein
VEEETFTSSLNIFPEACCRKDHVSQLMLGYLLEDDVTVIFLLGFSFMPEPNFIVIFGKLKPATAWG